MYRRLRIAHNLILKYKINVKMNTIYLFCTRSKQKCIWSGARSLKGPETFRARKAILVNRYLTAARCVRLKCVVWRELLFILRLKQLYSHEVWDFVTAFRYEILLKEGPSRNGRQGRVVLIQNKELVTKEYFVVVKKWFSLLVFCV